MATETLNLEVKSNIKSVTKESDDLGTSLSKAKGETKDLGGNLEDAGTKGAGGFKKMGIAVKGLGMALKAAGIGLVVALIAKLMEVFGQNQKVLDAFDTAMTALSIAFNDLFSFLSKNVGKVTGWFKDLFENPKQKLIDFGDAIKKNLIERFMSLLDVFGFLGKALKKLMKGEFGAAWDAVKEAGKEMVDVYTGVDDSVNKITETFNKAKDAIKDYTKKVYDSATAIVKLNKAAEMAAVINQGIIADKVREAELQRQIRDSEKATFADRIAANVKLKTILEEQKKAMMANADIMLKAAQAQVKINNNQANQIALQQTLNEKKAIEEQITGFMSEQYTNQESLVKELGEAKKQLAEESIEGLERELLELKNSYELKLDMARKAGVANSKIRKKYREEEQAIKDAGAKADKDRDKSVMGAKLKMAQNTLGAMAALAGENEAAGKAIAVAQTIFATQQAIMSALAGGGPDIALPYYVKLANAISAGIMGAVAIKTILSTSSGSGGGGSVPSAGGATPAPQMMSGAFELGGGQEIEPARAYVVSDDITDSQNSLEIIRRRATI
jgi:hypothetical protein